MRHVPSFTGEIGGSPAAPPSREIRDGFRNLACMTLYNEDFGMVRASLSALIGSLVEQDRHAGPGAGSCIAIVADGAEKIDAEVLAFLREAGLVDTGASFRALGETVHYSRKPAADVLAALGEDIALVGDISFAVCIKARNRGKLHSHAVFFQGICAALSPRYCYQIDAGTLLDVDSVSRMVAYMEENPDAAAAASHILTAPLTSDASPLAVWQYMDFVAQKAVVWPTEVAAGYLSIIPGQFCVFRWAAISESRNRETGERTVDSYLRGLKCDSPLERVMFLAEDRVFGNEIVLADHKDWKIGYCPDAEATTDACETFGELLRQRRRWLNSALAVRLSLWSRWPSYLRRDDKTVAEKVRFSAAMLWQGILTSCEVISPAFLALLLFAAFGGAVAATQSLLAAGTTLAFLATAVLTFLSFRRMPAGLARAVCAARDIGAGLSVALLIVCTVTLLPPAAAAILLAPPLVMAAAIAAGFPRNRWTVLRYFPIYLLIDRVMMPILYGYALANVHDVTWGTKGLVAETDAMRAEKLRMKHLRNVIAGTILVINASLLAIGLSYDGLVAQSTSIVIELASVLSLVVAVTAAITHSRIGAHRAPPPALHVSRPAMR